MYNTNPYQGYEEKPSVESARFPTAPNTDAEDSQDIYRFLPSLQSRFQISAEDDLFEDCVQSPRSSSPPSASAFATPPYSAQSIPPMNFIPKGNAIPNNAKSSQMNIHRQNIEKNSAKHESHGVHMPESPQGHSVYSLPTAHHSKKEPLFAPKSVHSEINGISDITIHSPKTAAMPHSPLQPTPAVTQESVHGLMQAHIAQDQPKLYATEANLQYASITNSPFKENVATSRIEYAEKAKGEIKSMVSQKPPQQPHQCSFKSMVGNVETQGTSWPADTDKEGSIENLFDGLEIQDPFATQSTFPENTVDFATQHSAFPFDAKGTFPYANAPATLSHLDVTKPADIPLKNQNQEIQTAAFPSTVENKMTTTHVEISALSLEELMQIVQNVPSNPSSNTNMLFHSFPSTGSIADALRHAQETNHWAEAFCLAAAAEKAQLSSVTQAFVTAHQGKLHPLLHWFLGNEYLCFDKEGAKAYWRECIRIAVDRSKIEADSEARMRRLVDFLENEKMLSAAELCVCVSKKLGWGSIISQKQPEELSYQSVKQENTVRELPPQLDVSFERNSENIPSQSQQLIHAPYAKQEKIETVFRQNEAYQPITIAPSQSPIVHSSENVFIRESVVLQTPAQEVPAVSSEIAPQQTADPFGAEHIDPALSLEMPAGPQKNAGDKSTWWPFQPKQKTKTAILPDDTAAPQFNALTGKWDSAFGEDDATDFDFAVQNGPPIGGAAGDTYQQSQFAHQPAKGLHMRYADSFNV